MPVNQLIDVVNIRKLIEQSDNIIVKPKTTYKIDVLFTEAFSKILDIDLLKSNEGKFNILSNPDDLIFVYNNKKFTLQDQSIKRIVVSNAYQLV